MIPKRRSSPAVAAGAESGCCRTTWLLATATPQCDDVPSLKRKTVTPHVLRHTTAMELLQHGIDRSVIALWLGHESVGDHPNVPPCGPSSKGTRPCPSIVPLGVKPRRYRPDDKLLAFLEGL